MVDEKKWMIVQMQWLFEILGVWVYVRLQWVRVALVWHG